LSEANVRLWTTKFKKEGEKAFREELSPKAKALFTAAKKELR